MLLSFGTTFTSDVVAGYIGYGFKIIYIKERGGKGRKQTYERHRISKQLSTVYLRFLRRNDISLDHTTD